MKTQAKALVLLSGGQDSITCAGWAMRQYEAVSCVSFDYGQRHRIELHYAQEFCQRHGLAHKLIHMPDLLGQVTSSALLDVAGTTSTSQLGVGGLPASFVPNRNALFLTLAHAWAQTIGAEYIVGGMCQTDYSGYPDCRREFVLALDAALNLGATGRTDGFEIVTPLMFLTKAETFGLAEDCGVLEDVLVRSNTCYEGRTDQVHAWGSGCGECPACKLRKKGFEEWKSR